MQPTDSGCVSSIMPFAIVVVAKLAHEQWAGGETATAQLIDGNVIVDAHLYGAIAGLAWGLLRHVLRRCNARKAV